MSGQRKQEKAAQVDRPKRRRIAKLQEVLNQYTQQKMAGMSALSQAAFDWSGNVRF